MGKKILAELRRIQKEHNGLLRPEDVVEEARDRKSPLHNSFTWDDSEAGRQYRLWEARQLIRVQVEYIGDDENKKPYPVFVSLKSDRQKDDGYREIVEVFANKTHREQLLEDAKQDMETFQRKYFGIQELEIVLEEMAKLTGRSILREKKKGKTIKRVANESIYETSARLSKGRYA